MRTVHLLPVLAVAACGPAIDQPDPATGVSPATLSWLLPKMTVDVEASFALVKCPRGASTELPVFKVVGATIAPKPVADPTARRSIVLEDLVGWRTSNEVKVKLNDDGTLASIGAKPKDETATIIGSVFKSAAQIAGLVVGAPVGAMAARRPSSGAYACTQQTENRLDQLAALREQQLDPKLKPDDLARITGAITRLEQVLVDKKTLHIAADRVAPWAANSPEPRQIVLTVREARANGWLKPAATTAEAAGQGTSTDRQLAHVALAWTPPIGPPVTAPVAVSGDFQYRQPVVATLALTTGDQPQDVLVHQDIAFAQFGTPRQLPFTVPLLASLDWSFSFAPDGTPNDMSVTTTARGVAAGTALNAATGAASQAMTQVQTAATANAELARVQAQDDLVKAKLSLIKDSNDLRAAGGTP